MVVTLADWTFETSQPTTGAAVAAESGINASTSFASGVGGATYTSPAGNGSSHSFSANGWDVGDYWQFKVPTTGYTTLTLVFDQTGSGTGPKNFKVATSPDGTTFTDLPSGAYSLLLSNWSSGTNHPEFTSATYSLPTALEGLAAAYVRLIDTSTTSINNGTVAVAGTDRIDNVIISGVAAVPEAPAVAFGALVCCVFGVTYGGKRLFGKKD